MASRHDMADWVYTAVRENGGSARLVEVAKHIWSEHESDLKASGNLLFTWQYDMRWAAMVLRKGRKLKPVNQCPKGLWVIAK